MTFKRKKTATLTLVLIASVSLTACQQTPKRSREVYRNLSDCSLEWGGADKCQPVKDGSHPTWYYYGPQYSNIRGTTYYYRAGSSKPLPVPSNAAIIDNSRPTLSLDADNCQGSVARNRGEECDEERNNGRSRRTTRSTGSFSHSDDSTNPGSRSTNSKANKTNSSSGRFSRSSGKTSRGGFGSSARSGSRGG
ncbi:MAG: hypothetical protein WA919_19135 [Coleofasciculaceae cyanobacterium]